VNKEGNGESEWKSETGQANVLGMKERISSTMGFFQHFIILIRAPNTSNP
jgi:hypothetical protein